MLKIYVRFGIGITEKHVEIMKNKLNYKSLNMQVAQGNALNLSRFEDAAYDSVTFWCC
ncbi:class I SAM-dependent methyltransferase [Romboutsia sedimentorum]|uniref:class I SAM-dependent methyltransferase n=1 Tax=Romboutsia sedimentorum TaxID=1368474 RepID=UPI0024DE0931|nr:class I SAM-dependent methyltransferase [Romboutsia sedimentorum]MDK2584553.1 class I SAM-dependent methyltransferase [Romboutsia sedimentorum]